MRNRELNTAGRFSQLRPLVMAALVMLSLSLSLLKGSTSASLYQLLHQDPTKFNLIFLKLRIPRTMTAFVCGSLLALAGSLMQLLLHNPLADPYVLGLSSGAALFTLIMILLGAGEYGVLGGAWIGCLLTILLILICSRRHQFRPHALLLSGIAITCGFSACISTLLLLSSATSVRSMLFWLTGDLNGARYPWLGLTILIIGFTLCMFLAPALNVLGRGDKEARALGLPSEKLHLILYLLSALFTAAAVTMAGCIGFVGLIIPHLARAFAGYDHQRSLPVSMLLGGSLLTLADTLSRSMLAPEQLPVGIIMALLGVPVFLWLLNR